MMTFLARQLAMVPHAHGAIGETAPSDHDARPHFHLSCFGHSHGNGHHHHERGERQSHSTSSNSPPGEHLDHDSDALYLPNELAAPLTVSNVATHDGLDLCPTFIVAVLPIAPPAPQCWTNAYLPDQSSPGRPLLYLALRALRL
jgi:hypothetical protein